MRRGDVEAVPAVFGGRMDLGLMYPDRHRFHITEFIGFSAIQAWYLKAIGEEAAAKRVYEAMREIAPDHPAVKQVRRLINPSPLQKLANALQRRLAKADQP